MDGKVALSGGGVLCECLFVGLAAAAGLAFPPRMRGQPAKAGSAPHADDALCPGARSALRLPAAALAAAADALPAAAAAGRGACLPRFPQLMEACWDADAAKRPSFKEVVEYFQVGPRVMSCRVQHGATTRTVRYAAGGWVVV